MSNKTHYVTELKQELAESQARIQLAKSMAIDFESFIMTHHKFIIDTTIQTGERMIASECQLVNEYTHVACTCKRNDNMSDVV